MENKNIIDDSSIINKGLGGYIQSEGGLYTEDTMLTDTNVFKYNPDGSWCEADGIYSSEGCITEDAKNKKKTKQIIKS